MQELSFGREVTSHVESALRREWLVTNGRGGYACGTLALANTRRYHGLLVAALQAPRGRTLLVSKLEATARLGSDLFHLTTNEYVDGTINPAGFLNLECFSLEGTIPVFTWTVADNRLEQRVWMAHGQNTTYVIYTLVRASRPIALEIVPLCTYRAARALTDVRGWMPDVRLAGGGLRVDAYAGATTYWLRANRGTCVPGVVRHWSLRYRAESYRGLDDAEDLFAIGRLDTKLSEGETLALVLTAEPEAEMDWQAAYEAERARQAGLLDRAGLGEEPAWVRRLVLAADQFVVDRPIQKAEEGPPGKTIIAGYPLFGDLGRDTLIALPGLAVTTGRGEVAADLLRTCARFADQGMLPYRLPGPGGPAEPEYGTADTTLWFFNALHHTLEGREDRSLLEALYPALVEILEWHVKGTRYGIGVDGSDGLLRVGEAPFALTWMNAQDGERAVTPRLGKPVEINALWHNALGAMAAFAAELKGEEEAARWRDMAGRVAASFEARFWYAAGRYLYDVVDGPEGDDSTLRPNQILAVGLPYSPLRDRDKARAVVEVVGRQLLTSYGLRSLAPRHPGYARRYGGNQSARANAAHQGTAWSWLLGPFVAAHLRVYGDAARARSFLRPFADHLASHGLGTVSELFDGDPPHIPRGCFASAAGVGQVLQAWLTTADR